MEGRSFFPNNPTKKVELSVQVPILAVEVLIFFLFYDKASHWKILKKQMKAVFKEN